MLDSFYHINESSELNQKKKKRIQNTHLAMFWNFCVGWRHDVNIWTVRYMTSWNLISHVFETRKFVKAILHGKLGLLCDKIFFPSKTGIKGQYLVLTLYHTIPPFNDLEEKAFWKCYGKRRKCCQPVFSSFPIICFLFYPSQYKFQFFSNINFVVCRCFQIGPVYNFFVW